MTEERVTRTETSDGNTHTETTIVRDSANNDSGGSKGWVLLVLLLVAVVAGIYIFSQMSGAEVVKDTAIADAASQVGDAAEQAGDAIEGVADEITDGE